MPTVKLHGLATAVPGNVIQQSDAAAVAAHVFSEKLRGFRRLAPIFKNAGIHKRYSVRRLSWFFEPHGWAARMDAHVDGASRLFVDAATRAIQKAVLEVQDIDSVVTVSSTAS